MTLYSCLVRLNALDSFLIGDVEGIVLTSVPGSHRIYVYNVGKGGVTLG